MRQRNIDVTVLAIPGLMRFVSFFVIAELIALHVVMIEVVIPAVNNRFNLFVPSKLGSKDMLLDAEAFFRMNGIVLIVAVVVVAVIQIFLENSNPDLMLAAVVMLILIAPGYMSLITANAFENLFHGLWWIVGASIPVGLAVPLVRGATRAVTSRVSRL